MQDTAQIKQKETTAAQENSRTNVSTEVDKVVIGTIAAFAGLVGIWSIACLVSAMIQYGGPLAVIKGWFSAVSGM